MLLALMRKELLALKRDPHGLAALFVLPMMFIIVMSMALKDVYAPRADNVVWSVIDEDKSAASTSLVTRWEKDNGKPVALPADWERALGAGQLKYVVRIERGASQDLMQTEKPERQRIALLAEPGIDVGLFTALRTRLEGTATAMRGEHIARKLLSPGDALSLDATALSGVNLVSAERIHAGPRPTSVQHNVPAWLVFGMFFVVTTIAGLFVEERSCGALNRLLSLGASPLMLLLAKVLPFVLINCLQAGLMVGVGVYLIPLLGGDALSLAGIDWWALGSMLLAISLAGISLALLVATLVRSQAQASAIGPLMNILMAAIGGIMVPTAVMPEAMQQLARFSPMNWGLEGLLDVLLRGGGMGSIAPEIAQLLLLGCVSLSLAYLVFRLKKS